MASNLAASESGALSKFARYWLPVLLMIGVMYYASTDVLSGENTRNLIEKILEWLAPNASGRTITRINFLVRKAAHFTEYAVLAWLLFRAFRADSLVRWRVRWLMYSLLICVCWALADELHQSFTRTRGGSVYDSLLDVSGAVVMLALISLNAVRVNRRNA
jgi:VanZ family protein